MENILFGTVAVLICVNLYASVKLIRSDLFDRTQKLFQGLLIWFIPLFGSILVLTIMSDHKTKATPSEERDERGYSLKHSGWHDGVGGGGDLD